jgi:hypothetical protein
MRHNCYPMHTFPNLFDVMNIYETKRYNLYTVGYFNGYIYSISAIPSVRDGKSWKMHLEIR